MKFQNPNEPNTQQQSVAAQMNQRVKENERFFSSFIDLVPASIYLNPDDRNEWIKLVKHEHKKNNPNSKPDVNGASGATNGKSSDGESADENDTTSTNDANFQNIDYKINKFEPRYFKTVTQILADFQQHDKGTAKKLLKQNRLRLKKSLLLKEKAKSTKIKVMNKSQNKSSSSPSSSTKKPNNDKETTGSENNGTTAAKKTAESKRMSKFKEQKNAAVKRLRQRYDSQTETQIVDVEHSEATTSNENKPILNKNGEIVYSKFDFTADKTIKDKKKSKERKLTPLNPKPKDYKKLLNKLEKEQEQIKELKEKDPKKAKELEMKNKWKTALNKAAGVKVKDDVNLLSKSIKRLDKKKQKAKKSWEERSQAVEERKAQAQEKRKKNLDKRKEKNREKKIKRLKKKGRIFPGF